MEFAPEVLTRPRAPAPTVTKPSTPWGSTLPAPSVCESSHSRHTSVSSQKLSRRLSGADLTPGGVHSSSASNTISPSALAANSEARGLLAQRIDRTGEPSVAH
eukprot:scaffold264494_cov27-Tisochrysis_lutea.AAC.1